jgi:hypothetical protein
MIFRPLREDPPGPNLNTSSPGTREPKHPPPAKNSRAAAQPERFTSPAPCRHMPEMSRKSQEPLRFPLITKGGSNHTAPARLQPLPPPRTDLASAPPGNHDRVGFTADGAENPTRIGLRGPGRPCAMPGRPRTARRGTGWPVRDPGFPLQGPARPRARPAEGPPGQGQPRPVTLARDCLRGPADQGRPARGPARPGTLPVRGRPGTARTGTAACAVPGTTRAGD